MKRTDRKFEPNSETLLKEVKKIVEKEGAKGWALARETLLKQETSTSQLREAINYILQLPDFFRPAFVSLCCKATGGDPEVTIPCGASLVLLGKAIGIHDDIIDNTRMRNKRLTAFGKFGKETALILSDFLLFKGFTLFRKNVEVGISERSIAEILETIDTVWFEQSESEFLELRQRRSMNVSPEECLIKIEKRASELEAIARIGGILGCGSREEIDILGKFGRCLGIMSILRNEIVDILEFDVLKHRNRYESLPLPLIYAMQNTKVKSEMLQIISKKRLTLADVEKLSKLTDAAEGISHVANYITEMGKKATECLDLLSTKNIELRIFIESLIINLKDWKSVS